MDLLTKLNNEEISLKEFEIQYIELLEQAKQMEKEQIQDAHLHAQFKVVEVKKELAEKYYNDFYGGNNE